MRKQPTATRTGATKQPVGDIHRRLTRLLSPSPVSVFRVGGSPPQAPTRMGEPKQLTSSTETAAGARSRGGSRRRCGLSLSCSGPTPNGFGRCSADARVGHGKPPWSEGMGIDSRE
jgi:hypothetical protein